ncbi:MAG: Acetoin:2,6-dichlorophenolindophenol oxidoreductase subunit alpha [Verrucomicrobiae bacterium]|nr:Acetoin:2,6-dichlorophenolindophenol oxidoreductase subunit alpha [Verrucomicrobiae bacterium]
MTSMPIDTTQARALYTKLVLIREVEELIAHAYAEQQMRCPTHLCVGQEAVPAAVGTALRPDDYIFGTYRGHGIYLAKGGSLRAMLAELYGKAAGVTRGKSGSMQLIAPEVGFLCASALVGGTIPIAVGGGLAAKMRGEDRVSVAVFGDAATEEGVFHEAMNFASLKKLPVVFVCENNFFAVYTHISARQCADNIYQRAAAYDMHGVRVDGNDIVAVYEAMREAVAVARNGGGPTLIEARTYRWREHCGPNWDNDLGYRSAEEAKNWMQQEPVKRFERFVTEARLLSADELRTIRERIVEEAAEALTFAKNSPFPDACELLTGVYAP